MADAKITELSVMTAPALTDIIPIADDPSGTPETQAIQLQTVLLIIDLLTEEPSVDGAADFLLLYDTSLGGVVKVLPDSLPVSEASITAHEAALSITESQISDLGTYATTSDITTAINNLVAAAPGALDTLNELAASLGDNADFAGSMTTALSGKAATTHVHNTADVTTGIFADARIGESSVTQHEAAITAGDVDINGQTADASPDGAADYVIIYDASAGTSKKVLLNNIPGGGDGDLSAVDIDTLAELNAIITDATLIDTADSRLSDARTPTSHSHDTADITTGTLAHARGGLEADVSAYAGVALIDGGTTTELKYNMGATTAPAVTEDDTGGYAVGSRWYDVTADKEYVCLDATTGTAVWGETTAAAGGGGSGDCCLTVIKKAADYTAVAGDLVVCDASSGAFTITMPASPADDDRVGVYLEHGNFTLNVTIQGNGKTLAEFGSSYVLHGPGELVVFQYDGVKWIVEGQNGAPFVDNKDHFFNSVDPTKIVRFNLASVSTATTRELTVPDASGTIELQGHTHAANDSVAVDWTARVAAESNQWQAIVYADGQFVAVSSTGTNRVMTSPDGINWTSRTVQTNSWRAITYGNGLFVGVSSDGISCVMTSADGINWLARNAPAQQWYGIAYGNGLFVAVSVDGSGVMTSPDGIDWTYRTAAESNNWVGITYGNGLFVAVSTNGTNRVMTSPDGINWTSRSAAEENSWYSVTYGNGLYVAVGSDGTHRVMTSPDGITWTARLAAEASQWNDVTYGNGVFVSTASGGTNQVMTSVDGINWTIRSAAEANAWSDVAYGNGLFVAVSTGGTNRVMTSGQQSDQLIIGEDSVPTAHAASHTDGSDDIQDATSSAKGLATATQIAKLNGIAAGATVGAGAHASNHTDGTDDIQDATASVKGLATATQIAKLDGIETAATADQTNAQITLAYDLSVAAATESDAIAQSSGSIHRWSPLRIGQAIRAGGIVKKAVQIDEAAPWHGLDCSSETSQPNACCWSNDDSVIFVLGFDRFVYQYTCTTPGDPGTASYDSKSLDCTGELNAGSGAGLDISPDGKRIYVGGNGVDKIHQYTMSTALDLSTAGAAASSPAWSSLDALIVGFAISPDETRALIVGRLGEDVFQLDFTTPGDVTSLIDSGNEFNMGGEGTNQGQASITVSPDGLTALVLNYADDTVYAYDLTEPWSAQGGTYSGNSFSVAGNDSLPLAVALNRAGTIALVAGNNEDQIEGHQLHADVSLPVFNMRPDQFLGADGTMKFVPKTGHTVRDATTVICAFGGRAEHQVDLTLTGNRTLKFNGPTKFGRYVIRLKQDGTGSRTVTWPTVPSIKWAGGSAPTLTTTGSKADRFVFVCTDATSGAEAYDAWVEAANI